MNKNFGAPDSVAPKFSDLSRAPPFATWSGCFRGALCSKLVSHREAVSYLKKNARGARRKKIAMLARMQRSQYVSSGDIFSLFQNCFQMKYFTFFCILTIAQLYVLTHNFVFLYHKSLICFGFNLFLVSLPTRYLPIISCFFIISR